MHPQYIKHILHPGRLYTSRFRDESISAARIMILEKGGKLSGRHESIILLILADIFSKLKAKAFKSDTIKGLIMKKFILAILIAPALVCAMDDGNKEALLEENYQILADLISGKNSTELVRASHELALRSQDIGLESEGMDSVNYDHKTNSIVARNDRNGKDRSVSIWVRKNLNNEKFDVDAIISDSSFMFRFAIADPSIVQRLKEKIAAFELERENS